MTRHPHPTLSSLAAFALAAALATACGGGGGEDGSAPQPPTEPPPGTPSTFDRIQEQVFSRSCASDSCHSSQGRAADLVLEPGASYQHLIGIAPSHRLARDLGMMRVAAGDPDASLLCRKIEADLPADFGASMPYGGPRLDDHTADIVRAWIQAGAPRTGVVPGDDGRPLGTREEEPGPRLEPPEYGVQLDVLGAEVPLGSEETRCHTRKLPSDVDLQVNRFEIEVEGGSHHIHIYRPLDRGVDLPDESYECNYALDFEQWELVAAAQLARTDWKLPDGVAFHFRAGEQLLVQTHFVNVGGLTTTGQPRVLVNLHAVPAETVRAQAGSIFGQDRDVFVPRLSVTSKSAECAFPAPITLMAMTGHYHYRGRRFVTERLADGAAVQPPLYEHEGYEDPEFLVWDDASAPSFAAGDVLRWTCTWENRNDWDYEFGPFTDVNEHCNLFAFYYPARSRSESTTCVLEEGVATTTVRASGS